MIRFIDVDLRSLAQPRPLARLIPGTAPHRFWWWGGQSWKGKLSGPLAVEVEDAPCEEAPVGLTDFFRTTDQWIVSSYLKAELEASGAEIEFWPTDVTYRCRTVTGEYFAANTIHRVRAVDTQKSDIEIDPELGDATAVRRLVLDESKILPRQWVVVEEVLKIAVSERLQEALLQSPLKGFRFVDPLEVRY